MLNVKLDVQLATARCRENAAVSWGEFRLFQR